MGLKLDESWANKWAKGITRTVYGQAPKLKMNDAEFTKRMEAAARYGFVQAMEHLMFVFYADEVNSTDLLIGDAQILMVREHNIIKKMFNGKIPDITVESIMEKAKAFKEQYEQQTKTTVAE